MPRFYERPIHPLEPLAEQGRYLLGMLMTRQRQRKQEEFQERRLEMAEQTAARVAESQELERARTEAELQRQGFRVTRTPTEGAGVRRPEFPRELFPAREAFGAGRMRDALARRIEGVPRTELPSSARGMFPQPRFREQIEDVGRPITFGGELQVKYDPALALEMAERSPAYILAEREREREEERRGELAEELAQAQAPEWLQSAVRYGLESPEAQVFSAYLRQRTEGPEGGLTPQDLYETKVEMMRQALILIRDRSSPEGRNIFGQNLGEIIDDVATEFGLDPEELRSYYRTALRTGQFEEFEAAAPPPPIAGGEPPPAQAGEPEPATDEEIEQARELVKGLNPEVARLHLRGEFLE